MNTASLYSLLTALFSNSFQGGNASPAGADNRCPIHGQAAHHSNDSPNQHARQHAPGEGAEAPAQYDFTPSQSDEDREFAGQQLRNSCYRSIIEKHERIIASIR